ncbi:TPA: hypothetical protein HA238_06290 [Candidatus Micrarchaeota archaeon]|nr:hypothetical protein [Candidatus Micrarchaeota archaeon]
MKINPGLFSVLALLVFVGILFAPLSVESYSVTPSVLKPGETGLIQITLKNVQPSGTTATTATIKNIKVYPYSAAGLEFTAEGPVFVGTLEASASAIASFPVRILANAKGGVISPSFQVNQEDVSAVQKLVVPVKVSNSPVLSLSLDKQSIRGTDSLVVTISNNGGAASKLTLKLNESGKFSLVGTDQIFVGEVNGSDSTQVQVNIDARTAANGVNTLQWVLSYQQEGGDSATEGKSIPITVKKESADLLFSQSSNIVTSTDNLLKITVKNTGKTLNDFRVTLESEGGFQTKESGELKLGTFASGEEKEISINVFVDAQPGVRSIKLNMKWAEDDVEKEDSITIPLVISSDADVGLFVDAKPAPLVVGGDHTLSVLVSNIGSYKIENVEVALEENDAFEIFNAQKSQYIGALESDDFSTVQYKIRIKKIVPGSYPIAVSVKYKDQSGVWVEKNMTREVLIRSQEEALSRGGLPSFVYIIGAAIVIGVLYWWFKMRKPSMPQHHS